MKEPSTLLTFNDNTCVRVGTKRNGYMTEYLRLYLAPSEEDDKPPHDYEVSLTRYCVPGRCDTYHFHWGRRGGFGSPAHVVFSSEGMYTSLSDAVKLLIADLDKPDVVKLFREAFSTERMVLKYQNEMRNLLKAIAPRSKTLKMFNILTAKTMKIRMERLESLKVEARESGMKEEAAHDYAYKHLNDRVSELQPA